MDNNVSNPDVVLLLLLRLRMRVQLHVQAADGLDPKQCDDLWYVLLRLKLGIRGCDEQQSR